MIHLLFPGFFSAVRGDGAAGRTETEFSFSLKDARRERGRRDTFDPPASERLFCSHNEIFFPPISALFRAADGEGLAATISKWLDLHIPNHFILIKIAAELARGNPLKPPTPSGWSAGIRAAGT